MNLSLDCIYTAIVPVWYSYNKLSSHEISSLFMLKHQRKTRKNSQTLRAQHFLYSKWRCSLRVHQNVEWGQQKSPTTFFILLTHDELFASSETAFGRQRRQQPKKMSAWACKASQNAIPVKKNKRLSLVSVDRPRSFAFFPPFKLWNKLFILLTHIEQLRPNFFSSIRTKLEYFTLMWMWTTDSSGDGNSILNARRRMMKKLNKKKFRGATKIYWHLSGFSRVFREALAIFLWDNMKIRENSAKIFLSFLYMSIFCVERTFDGYCAARHWRSWK